jgi:integrase
LRAELVTRVANGGVVGRKVTVADYSREWLAVQRGFLKKKTADNYEWALRKWVLPSLGRRLVSEVTTDDVAALVGRMLAEGKKAWTIRAVLTPLTALMNAAVRARLVSVNPVRGLTKQERPRGDQRVMRILSSEEIARLLSPVALTERGILEGHGVASVVPGPAAIAGRTERVQGSPPRSVSTAGKPPLSDHWRPLISFLLFTGLRIGEATALKWADLDLEAAHVTVRQSKTQAGTGRSVILIPALVSLLRHHRLRSPHSAPDDLVFTGVQGGMVNREYLLAKVLKPAISRAGVTPVTLHELRHTFASILIGQGFDVTFVADQLGHADPAITLRVYAKLFDPAARRDEARGKLQAAFGGLL